MPSLERFGFTPTETRLYESLLRLGPSTGYAVSKAAGVARANTYQALDGLVRRGAARRSATIPARYAALTPEAVVAEIERKLRRDLEALEATLRVLPRHAQSSGAPAEPDPSIDQAVDSVVRQLIPLLRALVEKELAG